jgi:hypothetical protein
MAGYGAEPTPERPTDDACERRSVAEPGLMTDSLSRLSPPFVKVPLEKGEPIHMGEDNRVRPRFEPWPST